MLDVQVRAPLGWTGREAYPTAVQSDGLRDRGVGFDDSGRNVVIPRGIVEIRDVELLGFATG